MPFGLTNAHVTFNKMMYILFRLHRNYIGVLFGDVIVYSKRIEEHKASMIIFPSLER